VRAVKSNQDKIMPKNKSTKRKSKADSFGVDATLLTKPESLHCELKKHYVPSSIGMMVHHPLIISQLFQKGCFGLVNQQYLTRKQAVTDAKTEKKWHDFVFLHERAYRCETFKQIQDDLSDTDYWNILGDIYIDSESVHSNLAFFKSTLCSPRPCREQIMNTQERRYLARLSERLTIYRGCWSAKGTGWSWTLDPKKAKWFALRFYEAFGGRPTVLVGEVGKNNVIAYFSRRKEKEIVVNPKTVTVIAREAIAPK
jgi:hypothetical protein